VERVHWSSYVCNECVGIINLKQSVPRIVLAGGRLLLTSQQRPSCRHFCDPGKPLGGLSSTMDPRTAAAF